MNRMFIACCSLFMATGLSAQVRFTDAASLTIIGKALPTTNPWNRVETASYPDLADVTSRMFRCSAGVAVAFRTDSKNITVRWKIKPRSVAVNQAPIAQSGMDLYIRRDGDWVWAGIGKPSVDNPLTTAKIVENMDSQVKECLLYLPLFAEEESVEIGVDGSAFIESLPCVFRHRIVVFGSSITHGASASRAGMAYPAQLSRRTGMNFINLGISGRALMQKEVTPIVCAAEADAYVLDCFSNPSGELIEQRLMPFVEALREAHPDTPLIFLQTVERQGGNFNKKTEKYESDKRKAAEIAMRRVMERWNDVYFINPRDILGKDHNATADGTHPTDLGFDRMIEKWQPEILKILKKYGIK